METKELVRDTCLCLHVQRAARAVARRYDESLRPLRLTNGQFTLLMSLARSKPPSMGLLAPALVMDRTTLTAALKPLVRRGLVEVTADPVDRRSRLMILTPTGLALLSQAMPVWSLTQAKIEALLPDADHDRFRAHLRALS